MIIVYSISDCNTFDPDDSLIREEDLTQESYDALIAQLDIRDMMASLSDDDPGDWVKNGHSRKTFYAYGEKRIIMIQSIWSRSLKKSHLIFFSCMLPFVRFTSDALAECLRAPENINTVTARSKARALIRSVLFSGGEDSVPAPHDVLLRLIGHFSRIISSDICSSVQCASGRSLFVRQYSHRRKKE